MAKPVPPRRYGLDIKDVFERNRVVRILIGISAVIGAVVTIGVAATATYRWYDRTLNWANRVESTLESLRANVNIEEFHSLLGRPKVTAPSESGDQIQHIYQGRGYWVQAVTDTNDAVLMFAVTACDAKLHPTWMLWNGRDSYTEITLNRTTIVNELNEKSGRYQWFISGATANSYIYTLFGGGNPSNYQSFAWGYNDACLHYEDLLSDEDIDVMIEDHTSGFVGKDARFPSVTESIKPRTREVFSRVTANTFAVFGLFQWLDFDKGAQQFQIGADRIITRTLQED